MKKFFTLIAVLTSGLSVFAQTNTVNGTVTDCAGAPVVGHPVYIMTDSTMMGSAGYYNVVYTDAAGYYSDAAITYAGAGAPEGIYIGTSDPAPGSGYYYATEFPTSGGNTYTHDFSVACDSSGTGGCAVSYWAWQDSTGTNDTLYLVVSYLSAAPSSTTFSWDYGDGSTGTGLWTTHLYSATGTYNVCVTLTDVATPCADTFCQNVNYVLRAGSGFVMKTVTALPTLSNNDIENKYSFNIYPNPVNDVVNISSTDLKEVNSVSIYDMTGREILTQNTNASQQNVQINTANLEQGSYVMILRNASKQTLHTHTLIKH